jgi:hypothetical protein
MTDETPTIRQVDWRALFPWLMLLRTTRFALSPMPLIVAAIAVLATSLGWGLAARVFLGQELEENVRIADEVAALRTWPKPLDPRLSNWRDRVHSPFLQPFLSLTAPVSRLFALESLSLRELSFYGFGILWMLIVWGGAAGIIVRAGLVRFAWEQSADPWQTLQFVAERYLSYTTAPLYPLFGVALLMVPLAIAGLVARSDLGALLVGIFWFLALLGGLAAVWLLIPLLFGFPLMWGAISAERDGDGFEALSNSMAYTYQRPLRYLGYVVVLMVLGALSVLVIDGAARTIVHLSYWGLSWGSGMQRALDLRLLAEQGPLAWDQSPPSEALQAAGWLLGMWTELVYLLAAGFRYSFFWTGAAGIYLLLRKDVDDKEIDEVFVPHEAPQLAHVARRAAANEAPAAAPTPAAAPSTSAAASPADAAKPDSGDIAPA